MKEIFPRAPVTALLESLRSDNDFAVIQRIRHLLIHRATLVHLTPAGSSPSLMLLAGDPWLGKDEQEGLEVKIGMLARDREWVASTCRQLTEETLHLVMER